MRLIVASLEKLLHVLRMVTFVQADVLATVWRGLRPGDRDAVEGRFKKFDIVSIGPADFDSQRDTATVREN